MRTAGSVTNWLRSLEQGDDDAAQQLWTRYSGEMHNVARRRMRRLKRLDVVDEEDIVISAFAAICLAARKGQLAKIANRNELWAMFLVSIGRKVGQREQYVDAAKRDGFSCTQSCTDLRLDSDSWRFACNLVACKAFHQLRRDNEHRRQ